MALFGKKKNSSSPDVDVASEVEGGNDVLATQEGISESKGFKDTLQRISKKLKFDSHHAIERFGIIVTVFIVSGVTLFGAAGWSSHSNAREQLSATALYTQSFMTSRTQVSGDVLGVYIDPSMTRTMVVLNVKDDTRLPSNADDYQFFLTGTDTDLNQYSLAEAPINGRYVTFGGNSDYMAVVLDNPEAFDLQILDLVVRVNREISYKEGEGAAGGQTSKDDPNAGDNSFQQYDQMRILFNPRASGATELKALGKAGSDFNAGTVYHEVVTKESEETIRAQMDAQLLQMQADLARIEQYESQLATTSVDDRGTTLRLNMPKVPPVIAGDQVTGEDAKSNKDGESTLALSSGTVIAGGYDFNWRAGNVKDGYLEEVVPDGMSYVDFMQAQSGLSKDTPDWQKVEFTLNNGTPLLTYTNRDTFIKPLLDLRSNLMSSWQTYYEHKVDYQVDSYNELLTLEIELRNVETNTMQNIGEDVLTLY